MSEQVRYTPAATKAIYDASGIAKEMGATAVCSTHLLLSLLSGEQKSVIAIIEGIVSMPIEEFRSDVLSSIRSTSTVTMRNSETVEALLKIEDALNRLVETLRSTDASAG